MMSKFMKEDCCPGKIPGGAGGIDSFEGKSVEESRDAYFDGAVLLEFFREMLARHDGQFPAKGSGNIRVFFWDMTEEDYEEADKDGPSLCFQIDNSVYVISQTGRKDG